MRDYKVLMLWVDKYKPKKGSEVVGNEEIVRAVKEDIKKGRAVILSGPTGVGKTCIAEALARELGYDIIEMNASNERTKNTINERLLTAATQNSIFMRPKLILIDEADGLRSSGITAIKNIISVSKFPIIITVNDSWSVSALKSSCKEYKLKRPIIFQIRALLERIVEKEGVSADKSVLKEVATLSGRDVRAAVNDLEMLCRNKKEITLDDLKKLGYRDRKTEVFDSLKIIFKTKRLVNAKRAVENINEDPQLMMLWIEENILREYEDADDIARAYDAISRADVFAGRIRRRQDWSLLKYVIDNMTVGVSVAKKEMYRKFTRYQFPTMIRMMGASRARRNARKNLLNKIRAVCHCGFSDAEEYLPLLKLIGDKMDWLEKEDLKLIKTLV